MITHEEAKQLIRDASVKIKPENSGKYCNIIYVWEVNEIINKIYHDTSLPEFYDEVLGQGRR